MDKLGKAVFIAGVALWGLFVAVLLTYLFFPYQKAFKVALQNVAADGRMTIALEGVNTKALGIEASGLLLRPDANTGQAAPFRLSKVAISWNPLSLMQGKLSIHSKASVYDGTLWCTIEGPPLAGLSNPNILLRVKGVNIGECPEGSLPWFKGVSGILDGVIRKEMIVASLDRQVGSFRFSLKDGELRDLRLKNLPRLIIPYKGIVIEGRIDGTRLDVKRIALTSDVVSLIGSGVVETGEFEQNIDIKLSYTALSKASPLKGRGEISISGNQAAPRVTAKRIE